MKKTTQSPSAIIRRVEQERRARIILRKVDSLLKSESIEAALVALTKARVEAPLIATTLCWFNRYRDMLLDWQADIMPEVVDEFEEYGFRRASNVAHRSMVAISNPRILSLYGNCQEALADMADRSRLSISDQERDSIPNRPDPQEISLEDVSEEELQRGEKL